MVTPFICVLFKSGKSDEPQVQSGARFASCSYYALRKRAGKTLTPPRIIEIGARLRFWPRRWPGNCGGDDRATRFLPLGEGGGQDEKGGLRHFRAVGFAALVGRRLLRNPLFSLAKELPHAHPHLDRINPRIGVAQSGIRNVLIADLHAESMLVTQQVHAQRR